MYTRLLTIALRIYILMRSLIPSIKYVINCNKRQYVVINCVINVVIAGNQLIIVLFYVA